MSNNWWTNLRGDNQLAIPDTRKTPKERLDDKANAPLEPTRKQQPMDIGLWNESDKSPQLFDKT